VWRSQPLDAEVAARVTGPADPDPPMRPYGRAIFLAIVFIQVAWFCRDARDWCLWLPGLAIAAAGLMADRRPYLCGNTLFWIVCLVLYIIAPASQLEDNYFSGPISVIGIRFPDAIIAQTVALADAFMGTVLISQLVLRRCFATPSLGAGTAGRCPIPVWPARPLPSPESIEAEDASGHGSGPADAPYSSEDNQVYIIVEDPGEFQHLPAIDDKVAVAVPPAREPEERVVPTSARAGDCISAILHSRVLALAMVLIGIGVPAAMYVLVGNLDFATNGREFALSAFADPALGTLINSFTQDLLVVLCLLCIERYLASRSTDDLLLMAVVAVFTLLMINPLNTARYQVGAVLILALLFSCRGRIPMALSYTGIALYIYAIMPLMNLLRSGIAGLQGQKVAIGIDFNSLDYDCFSMFAFAVYRTWLQDFTYGRYLCSSALFFLPRSWWPDKPRPSSLELGQDLMQHHSGWFDNLSCPPMGDAYMDFGLAGVLCMGVLFGYLIECSDQVIDRWSQSTFIRRGLAAAFVAFIPILLRGSLGAVMGFVIAPVVLLLILWVLARSYRGAVDIDAPSRLAWKMR
jgi:hypothetical protein